MLYTTGHFGIVDELLSLVYNNKVIFNKEGAKIPLPGVGKKNIKVEMIPDKYLLVKWKGQNDKENEVRFAIENVKEVAADYTDGMLTLKPTFEEEKKKLREIEIK